MTTIYSSLVEAQLWSSLHIHVSIIIDVYYLQSHVSVRHFLPCLETVEWSWSLNAIVETWVILSDVSLIFQIYCLNCTQLILSSNVVRLKSEYRQRRYNEYSIKLFPHCLIEYSKQLYKSQIENIVTRGFIVCW